jgi:hypothetical protein
MRGGWSVSVCIQGRKDGEHTRERLPSSAWAFIGGVDISSVHINAFVNLFFTYRCVGELACVEVLILDVVDIERSAMNELYELQHLSTVTILAVSSPR